MKPSGRQIEFCMRILGCLVLVMVTLLSVTMPGVSSAESRKGRVDKVLDGNSVRLAGGERLRYIGVGLPASLGKESFEAARKRNRALVEGKEIIYTYGIQRQAKDGVSMAYVIAGDVFVNAALIVEGYACAEVYPPDVRYAKEFVKLQQYAEQHRLGIWKDRENGAGEAPASRSAVTGERKDKSSQQQKQGRKDDGSGVEHYGSFSVSGQDSGRTATKRRVEYRSSSLQGHRDQGSGGRACRKGDKVPIEIFVSRAADDFIKKYILDEH